VLSIKKYFLIIFIVTNFLFSPINSLFFIPVRGEPVEPSFYYFKSSYCFAIGSLNFILKFFAPFQPSLIQAFRLGKLRRTRAAASAIALATAEPLYTKGALALWNPGSQP
jgi:hypothetical protein